VLLVKGFWAVFKRELFSLFVTPLAWILLAVFVFIEGLHFYWIVRDAAGQAASGEASGTSPAQLFFGGTILLYLPLFFICPLLTMRLFAEERRSGTIEALLTAPVGTVGVVLGKYLATFAMYAVLWLPTLLYIVLLSRYGEVDVRTVVTGYAGIMAIGAGYLALGTMTSALTSSQLVAAVVSGLGIIGLFLFSFGEFIFDPGTAHDVCTYVSAWSMMNELSRGLIDSRRIVYTACIVVVPLFFTVRTVESWRWG
jgi:ABC-2 type transport system permease protein